RYGAGEGRKPNAAALQIEDKQLVESSGLFDPAWYLAQYPDAAQSGIDPLEHYLSVGAAENRSPGPGFDAAWYLAQSPDLATAKLNPLLHYLRYGAGEGRKPNAAALQIEDKRLVESSGLFDPAWYLAQHPDVAELGIDPVEHYLSVGAAEGYSPGP